MQVTISNKICRVMILLLPGYNNTQYLCDSHTGHIQYFYAKVQVQSSYSSFSLKSILLGKILENNSKFENLKKPRNYY